tara:strand:- start:3688 stop:4002 length:315 start_codon:yes stop_codon:yes gene_type:complete
MSLVYTIGKSNRSYESAGDQTLTVSSSSVSLTVPDRARHAFILIQDATVSVSFDGTAATTSNLPLPVGDVLDFMDGRNNYDMLSNLRFIRTGSDDGKAYAVWFD